mmetsp:Transcript_1911/g.6850  ORF Transcript_1911/g.6850 Transcript_1911/m.6850 type:complete len:212 (-) Transcript_1911:1298-1933(-)
MQARRSDRKWSHAAAFPTPSSETWNAKPGRSLQSLLSMSESPGIRRGQCGATPPSKEREGPCVLSCAWMKLHCAPGSTSLVPDHRRLVPEREPILSASSSQPGLAHHPPDRPHMSVSLSLRSCPTQGSTAPEESAELQSRWNWKGFVWTVAHRLHCLSLQPLTWPQAHRWLPASSCATVGPHDKHLLFPFSSLCAGARPYHHYLAVLWSRR